MYFFLSRNQKCEEECNFFLFLFVFPAPQNEPNVVPQTDLVPTLALLLGIPIPYSSVGQVLLPLFQEKTAGAVAGLSQLEALWINAKQVACIAFQR